MEKFILAKSLHFSQINRGVSVPRGAVVEYDKESRYVIIDGRRYEEVSDVEIAIRHDLKFPEDKWLEPYSEDSYKAIISYDPADDLPKSGVEKKDNSSMPVVQSDEDDYDTIDITATKVAAKANREREDSRKKGSGNLEIIKGEQTAEEKRLSDETISSENIANVARRIKEMGETPAKMPIIKDDSLGVSVASGVAANNAGQNLPSRKEIESRDAAAYADSLKKEVEINRGSQGIEVPEGLEVIHTPDGRQSKLQSESGGDELTELRSLQKALQDKIDGLEGKFSQIEEVEQEKVAVEIENSDQDDIFTTV